MTKMIMDIMWHVMDINDDGDVSREDIETNIIVMSEGADGAMQEEASNFWNDWLDQIEVQEEAGQVYRAVIEVEVDYFTDWWTGESDATHCVNKVWSNLVCDIDKLLADRQEIHDGIQLNPIVVEDGNIK